MKEIKTLSEVKAVLQHNMLVMLFISQPNCSVCVSLLPQVKSLLHRFPNIIAVEINTEEIEEIAGEYLIFTVPAILLFVNGKEVLRKVRFVRMKELESDLTNFMQAIE